MTSLTSSISASATTAASPAEVKMVSEVPDETTALLPDVIWLKIFAQLPTRDICTACQVCSKWHDLANDDLLWRQKLSRDASRWSVVSHDSYPQTYRNFNSDWTSKEIYLTCSPESNMHSKSGGLTLRSLKSLIRSIFPYYTPTVAMFGPGLESETSGIFRKILMDESGVFFRGGLTPGEFSGIGSGIKFSLHNRYKFNLTALYSGTCRERHQHTAGERLRVNKLYRRSQSRRVDDIHQLQLAANEADVADQALDEDSDDRLGREHLPQLTEPVTRLCRAVGAFVFVINAAKDKSPDDLKMARRELLTMVDDRISSKDVPLLVLSCVLDDEALRLSCIDVVRSLQLDRLSRPWQVRDCVVENLHGVAPAMEWLLRKAQCT